MTLIVTLKIDNILCLGVAIDYMLKEGFNKLNGARDGSENVKRIAIVITDGMAQDNVTGPAKRAQNSNVTLFAVGVSDFVSEKELVQIASGQKDHTFLVGAFTELNTRLRSMVQKKLCPQGTLLLTCIFYF